MGILKVAVLGLGDSLKLFQPEGYDYVIGVNDIWHYVETDAVVVLDYPRAFEPVRLKPIQECKPKVFYSQLVVWDQRSDFRKIDLLTGYPDRLVDLDQKAFCKSFCSPFVAVQVAWKYHGAEEIHLFGVDLLNHPHFDRNICHKIKIHFQNLRIALTAKACKLVVHGEGILTA